MSFERNTNSDAYVTPNSIVPYSQCCFPDADINTLIIKEENNHLKFS